MMRVAANCMFTAPGDVYATGINVDSLNKSMTLSNGGGIFIGAAKVDAIHVGMDKFTTDGHGGAQATSVPFRWGDGKAVAIVSLIASPMSAGFTIIDALTRKVMVSRGPQAVASGVQIRQ